jgi:ADP-ribosylglycohydrolase
MTVPRKAQFSGCLIGQCLGDALGCPVEGQRPGGAAGYVNAFLRTTLVGSFGRPGYPFGQYTDDSQLARELMQSFVACQQFDPGDYAHRIAAIFSERRVVGQGQATTEAARRLTRGVRWQEAGTPPPSAGNGSAMRAGPIGLFFYDDPERMLRAAHDQGRMTHQDPRCSAGAVSVAGAVALALLNETIDLEWFLTSLSQWVQAIDPSVAAAIRQLKGWITLPPEEAISFISVAGLGPGYLDHWEGISPFVTGSVLWSLYSFLRSPEDYWETICTAITPGGDVDTTAAMAGAISGAHVGLEAIPVALAHRLTDQGTWGYAELVELADQCYDLKLEQRDSGANV